METFKKLLSNFSILSAIVAIIGAFFVLVLTVTNVGSTFSSEGALVGAFGAVVGIVTSYFSIIVLRRISRKKNYVFLSFVDSDSDRVLDIKKRLDLAGFVIYDLKNKVRVGDNIEAVVNSALSECKSMVVVISEKSKNSKWQSVEVKKAQSQRINIFPLLIDDIEPPSQFKGIRYARYFKNGIDELDLVVNSILDKK